MTPPHLLPFSQSGSAALLFLAGFVSILSGASLVFDDRKLNKYLFSYVVMNSGVMLIYDGLKILGFSRFEKLKTSTLVIQVFLGLLSIIFIWAYHYERKQKIQERKLNPSVDNSNDKGFKK